MTGTKPHVDMRFGSGLPTFSYSLGSNSIQASLSHSNLNIHVPASLSLSPQALYLRPVPYNHSVLLKNHSISSFAGATWFMNHVSKGLGV